MPKKKAEPTGLYTSKTGVIACEAHASGEEGAWRGMATKEVERFEREVGRKPACETCGPATGMETPTNDASKPDAPAPGVLATDATPALKLRKAKKAKPTASDITLEDLATRYLAHLEEVGKSNGTLFSYKLELVVAMDEIGAKTKLADLTPARVLEFFVCERVMKTRTGVAKARPTYEKTRRVLRQALVWAQEVGVIEKAPLPEDAASY